MAPNWVFTISAGAPDYRKVDCIFSWAKRALLTVGTGPICWREARLILCEDRRGARHCSLRRGL